MGYGIVGIAGQEGVAVGGRGDLTTVIDRVGDRVVAKEGCQVGDGAIGLAQKGAAGGAGD